MEKRKTRQYQELCALVEVPENAEAEKSVKRYMTVARILRIMALISLVLFLAANLLYPQWIQVSLCFAIAIPTSYFVWRSHYFKVISNVLREECDPVKALPIFSELCAYTKKPSGYPWVHNYYNLATILRYAGRGEDAQKVQTLLTRYSKSAMAQFYALAINIELALSRLDFESVCQECEKLQRLVGQPRMIGYNEFLYKSLMQYPHLIRMYQAGAYGELYQSIEQSKSWGYTKSVEVRKNYYLYHIAKRLGNNEKMQVHKDYVLQYGGTFWYRRKLESENF